MNSVVLKIYDILNKLLRVVFNNLKQENIIVFESNPSFTDNTKAVFDEMINRRVNEKYRMFWISRDDVDNSVFSNYKNVYPIDSTTSSLIKQVKNTIKKAYYFSKAKAVISCNVFQPKFTDKKQYYVDLTHGAPNKNSSSYYMLPKYYDESIAISEYFIPSTMNTYFCDESIIVPLGYPRNDILFENPIDLHYLFPKNHYSKLIYWLPTFRQHKCGIDSHSNISMPIIYNERIAEEINECAKTNDVLIVVKPHPVQDVTKIKEMQLSNLIFINNDFLINNNIENYELLRSCDSLLSDYSSVYYDYLICNKPIGLCFDDFEEYNKREGFVVDVDYIFSGGEKIYNEKDMCDYIVRIASDQDILKKERNDLKKVIYANADNQASLRVVDHILDKLETEFL